MKKAVVLLMGIALTFSLAACGNKKDDNKTGTEGTTGQTESTTGTTESETTNGTDSTGETSTETSSGTGDEGYGEAGMEDLKATVVEVLGENYWPNMTIEEDMLGEMLGINADVYEEYFAEMPMISTNVDTLIIVKAKEGQVEAVEEALNAYREKLVNDTMQYPMNLGKIQASRIETFGNYVCFVQLGADVSDAMDQGEDAVISQCQEENEKALDAIRTVLLK